MAQKKITDLTLRSDFDETCNVPVDDATQTYRVTGQQILDFVQDEFPQKTAQDEITNLTLATSVAGSALTIAVKTAAGNNASSTDVITVGMRSSTLTSGSYSLRTITSALSLVISSGSTLGQTSAQASTIYVYLIDNAGTLELAASHTYYPDDTLVNTTAEGGAGAADSATTIYSTTSRSSVAIRCIGTIVNTQATAGTWASAGTQIQLQPSDSWKAPTVQRLTSGSGTYNTPAGVRYLKVKMVGGGGGGSGSGGSRGAGGDGGNTTFGSSLLTANGGAGALDSASNSPGGIGGSATVNSPAISIVALSGGTGNGGNPVLTTSDCVPGSPGASSPFGGAGYCTGATSSGTASAGGSAVTNTGSGGGGASNQNNGAYTGSGGGAGAYIEAIIPTPSSSYAYAVGAAGTAGTGSVSGGAGGSGVIIVEEYYQ